MRAAPHCFNAALVRPMEGWPASGPSVELMHHSWLEQRFLRPLFLDVLNGTCTRPNGKRKVVWDVGANIGLYALYFATRGCEVHAIEALPVNADHVMLSARINRVEGHMHVHGVAATHREQRNLSLRFSWQETGLTHVVRPFETVLNSTNHYVSDQRRPQAKHFHWHTLRSVRGAPLDQLYDEHAAGDIDWMKGACECCVWSPRPTRGLPFSYPHQADHGSRLDAPSPLPCAYAVDVEGSELSALCGARQLFRNRRVRWLGFELNYETTPRADAVRIRRLLAGYGMHHRHLPSLGKDGVWRWRDFLNREGAWRRKGYMVMYSKEEPGEPKAVGEQGRWADTEVNAACDDVR